FYCVDVLLARALLAPELAGHYAVASLLGKGILFGVVPVTRVMFPLAAGAPTGSAIRRRMLAGTLGLLAACIAPALLLVALFPLQIVRFAGGPAYGGAAPIALLVTSAMGLMAFSNTLLLFRLAAGVPRGWAALPALLLLEAGLLVASRGSLLAYGRAVLLANAAFLVASIVLALQPALHQASTGVTGASPLRSPEPSAPPPPPA